MATIEDFESGTSIFTDGDVSFFTVETGTPFEGVYYLSHSNNDSVHRSVRGSSWDNTTTDTLKGYLRADVGGTNLVQLRFGAQPSGFQGYSVCIDTRNSTEDAAGFQLRIDNSTSPLAFATVAIDTGTWYRVEVDWRNTSPRITARLYNGNSTTPLAVLTSDSTTYTSGALGLIAFNAASVDGIRFSDPIPPGPFDVVLRQPSNFDIILFDDISPALTVYIGNSWDLRYVGVTDDSTLYVGNITLR